MQVRQFGWGGGAALFVVALVAFACGDLIVGAEQDVRIDGLLVKNPPDTLKPAVARFLQRESQFKSQLTIPAHSSFPLHSAFPKWQAQEKTVYALFDVPNASRLATGFVREVPLLYEWEGMASSALQEATSALEYLGRHPNTPLAGYVHFFAAHRYACAAEMPYETGNVKLTAEVKAIYTQKMQDELKLAGQTAQPLLKFLSHEFAAHPRCNDTSPSGR